MTGRVVLYVVGSEYQLFPAYKLSSVNLCVDCGLHQLVIFGCQLWPGDLNAQ